MKNQLRQKYKLLRAELSEQQIDDLSFEIYQNLLHHFNLQNKNISIFLPIKKFKEVNTWHIINHIKANYYLPVVKGKELKHIKYEDKHQLKLSNWGIEEPTFGEEAQPDLFDVVIVPMLAYDKKGNRVGYGAGFYDGFLKECKPNCLFIGVSFFSPEHDEIKTYETDIPLHFAVTPHHIYQFK